MRAVLFIALLLPAILPALEVDDLRVSYAPWAGRTFDFSAHLEDQAPSQGFSDSSDVQASTDAYQHRRYALEYRRSVGDLQAGYGAPLWGLEFTDDRVRDRQGAIEFTGRTELIDVVLGWAWRIRPGWHLEQGVIGGVGHSQWHHRFPKFYLDATDFDDTASGFAYEYGFTIATYYAFANGVEVGLDVRHIVTRTRVRFIGTRDVTGAGDYESISLDAKIETSGFGAAFVTGYRF